MNVEVLQDIAARLKAGYPVNNQEKAYLLRYNPAALAAFMVENNPGSLNLRLKQRWGYTHLPFAPDKKAIARQLQILLDRNEAAVLDDLRQNFNLVPDGYDPDFVQQFIKYQNT